ncbi:MAG: EAL domain-containing response regulator [Polyangiaceae bacterium]|nr:EAL domain-containing response regulator [Polyangiaceae bacterium]
MDGAQAENATGRILVVDDEPEPLRAAARVVRRLGHVVDTFEDGASALAALRLGAYDVVVSDISMPGLDGIALLRAAHERDPELPVILFTGAPAVETALQALELRAFKYLLKPVSADKLEHAVTQAFAMRRMAQMRRQAAAVAAAGVGAEESAAAFERALEGLWVAFQPVVRNDGRLYGYEAFMRSAEPSLAEPTALLEAAERCGRIEELGRRVRELAVGPMLDHPERGVLFLNVHVRELFDPVLTAPDTPTGRIATRVVLELTERATFTGLGDLRAQAARLRAVGYRVSVDDLGAGYAGLASFAQLEPEIVKVDMSLVRDVDKHRTKEKLIASMVSLCREMGMLVVAEGIETRAERDTLVSLGCHLYQGYFVAHPAPPFPRHVW